MQKKALGTHMKCVSDNELLTARFFKKLRTELSMRRGSPGQGLVLKHYSTTAATNRWATGLAHRAAFGVPLGELGEGKGTQVAKTRKQHNRGSCYDPFRMASYEKASFIPSQFGGN